MQEPTVCNVLVHARAYVSPYLCGFGSFPTLGDFSFLKENRCADEELVITQPFSEFELANQAAKHIRETSSAANPKLARDNNEFCVHANSSGESNYKFREGLFFNDKEDGFIQTAYILGYSRENIANKTFRKRWAIEDRLIVHGLGLDIKKRFNDRDWEGIDEESILDDNLEKLRGFVVALEDCELYSEHEDFDEHGALDFTIDEASWLKMYRGIAPSRLAYDDRMAWVGEFCRESYYVPRWAIEFLHEIAVLWDLRDIELLSSYELRSYDRIINCLSKLRKDSPFWRTLFDLLAPWEMQISRELLLHYFSEMKQCLLEKRHPLGLPHLNYCAAALLRHHPEAGTKDSEHFPLHCFLNRDVAALHLLAMQGHTLSAFFGDALITNSVHSGKPYSNEGYDFERVWKSHESSSLEAESFLASVFPDRPDLAILLSEVFSTDREELDDHHDSSHRVWAMINRGFR